ncbi:serine/threonine-protein kinase EDR1-like [Magnolia sinica]|uniref:serine/threonine-protein kinase EDR1-like n=1 Tax=Magnolia sinica TaxID=86752 RepID=UPI002657C124|nr:serine/threonine-protein kinase EDR1-like [Magnolia sinica]
MTTKSYGMKVHMSMCEKVMKCFQNELTLLEKVRHPNVVQFVGAVTQNIPMMIVSEYHPKETSRYKYHVDELTLLHVALLLHLYLHCSTLWFFVY